MAEAYPAPTNFGTTVSGNDITFTWGANSSVQYYTIYAFYNSIDTNTSNGKFIINVFVPNGGTVTKTYSFDTTNGLINLTKDKNRSFYYFRVTTLGDGSRPNSWSASKYVEWGYVAKKFTYTITKTYYTNTTTLKNFNLNVSRSENAPGEKLDGYCEIQYAEYIDGVSESFTNYSTRVNIGSSSTLSLKNTLDVNKDYLIRVRANSNTGSSYKGQRSDWWVYPRVSVVELQATSAKIRLLYSICATSSSDKPVFYFTANTDPTSPEYVMATGNIDYDTGRQYYGNLILSGFGIEDGNKTDIQCQQTAAGEYYIDLLFTNLTSGQEYNIYFTNGLYLSDLGTLSFTPPLVLDQPTGLTISNITSSAAIVSWDSVPNASSYQITYTQSGGTATTVTSTTNSVSLVGLEASTSYSVDVIAIDDNGYYADSASASVTFITPLATPTGLAVSNVAYASTYAKQTVTWNSVANATSYKLEWKKSTDSTWTAETVSGATSISYDNRARNTTYDYRVTAIGDGASYENSAASATVSLKTKQRLATPSALTCVSKTATSLTFEWSPVTGTKTYALGYKLTSASSYTYILTESPSATITGLTANTAYNVLVQAREATDATNYDTSAYSSALTATTLTPLSAPTGLTSSSVTSSSATVSWTAVTNASSYQITYTPSGGTSTTVTSSTNSVALTNLSGATSYSVEVVAVGDGTTYTDSSSSSALSFTTLQKLATPTGLKVTNDAVITTTAKQTITWNTVANATGYKLEYKQSTSTTWGSETRTAPPVIFPDRTRNVSYNHRITALGDGTTYDDSDTSSVVTKKSKQQLATPTGLTCTNKTETTLTFSWNEVSGTKTYYLRYLLPTASSHSYVYASSSPATITGLTPGTTYNVDIGARVATDSTNYDGSVYTDKIPVTTLTQLSAPTGITHDQVTSTSARVGWNAVTNAVDYKVEYRRQGDTTWNE